MMSSGALTLSVGGQEIDVIVVDFNPPTGSEAQDLEELKGIAKEHNVKRIILGHIPFEVLGSSLAEASPPKREEPVIAVARNMYYRPPREPESWQGKGNRRKPKCR